MPRLHVLYPALFWTCAWFAPAFAQSTALTPQERLDAIRQSLVESSLQTPTKVTTTQWIDGQGSLREASSFKNGMEVRGVRIVSYDKDDQGNPRAKLLYPSTESAIQRANVTGIQGALQKINKALDKVSDFAKQWTPVELNEGKTSCQIKSGEHMKHVVSLDLDIDPSSNRVVLTSLLPLVQAQWVKTDASNSAHAWRMVNNLPPPSVSQTMTNYERALVSHRPLSLPWHAQLKISTELQEGPGIAGLMGAKGPGVLVNLSLRLSSPQAPHHVYQNTVSVPVTLESSGWGSNKLQADGVSALQSSLQSWRHEAEQWLSCQNISAPQVTAVSPRQVEINAGGLAGVRQGDEWLIANPAVFPSGLLGKDGAPQTVLAQVQSVSAYQAQLVLLAGPAQAIQPNWRAWPTDTLVKEPSLAPQQPQRKNKP